MSKGFRLTPDRKLKITENDVEKACKQYLQYRHFYPIRQQSGLFPTPDSLCELCRANARWIRVGEVGIPDYVIPRFFLEVKAPGKSASALQQEKIWQLEKFWDLKTAVPTKIEELIEWLEKNKGNL